MRSLPVPFLGGQRPAVDARVGRFVLGALLTILVGCGHAETDSARFRAGKLPRECFDYKTQAVQENPLCRCFFAFDSQIRSYSDSELETDRLCIDAEKRTGDADHPDLVDVPDAATEANNPRLVVGPASVIRQANRNVVVGVLLGKDKDDTVVTPVAILAGTKGTYVPETMNGAPAPAPREGIMDALKFQTAAVELPPWPQVRARFFRFVPRVPGDATLTLSFTTKKDSKGAGTPSGAGITITNNQSVNIQVTNSAAAADAGGKGAADAGGKGGADAATQYTYEYFVPPEYSGALRFGLSAVYAGGDHAYAIRKAPDATLGTVVDNGVSAFDAEVALGYTFFFGNRIYAGRHSWTNLGLYTGLGLVSGSTSGVTWLRSIYVGLDYELSANSSLVLAGMVRRVNNLASGIAVGDPVADNTSLTSTGYAPTFGILLNFTPDFLKFASGLGTPK